METSNFTANCAGSAQFANQRSKSREISTINSNFLKFPAPLSKAAIFSANHAKSAQFANP